MLESLSSSTVDVIGVGSPLVDLILHVDDKFLAKHVGGAKGGMELVDAEHIHAIVAARGKMPERSPGGSAANITVGCANLGVPSAFIGSCGADEFGQYYVRALGEHRCEGRLVEHAELPTGLVLALVTPDGERTMRTCLGAAAALDPAHLTPETFRGARVVMVEGYSLYNHALIRAVISAAKAAGCAVALDLAAHEVVRANRGILEELMPHVDLLFANQDEALAWNEAGHEAALADFAAVAPVAVVKLGKDGALIAHAGVHHHVPTTPVTPV
ncbi:MAG: adenosine kinase, partial [Planctomycetes bacterium]|nr:adenosine kinase [Planctomycetota bacterium]